MSRMGKIYLRSGLVIIFTVFFILFGVSLANNGVERIYGPMDQEQIMKEAAAKEKRKAEELEAQKKKEDAEKKEEEAKLSYEEIKRIRSQTEQDSLFGSIGNGIGNMLKQLAQFIVSLFSGIFDLFV